MSGFSETWLALREPADHRARAGGTTDALLHTVLERLGPTTIREPLRIVDLATGSGSNVRYLAPQLGPWQDWTALDADPVLLEALPARMAAWATRSRAACIQSAGQVVVESAEQRIVVHPTPRNLSTSGPAMIEGPVHLVTCSALLDLVSEGWIQALAQACVRQGAAFLGALTYDGRTTIVPTHPLDEVVVDLVNQHQRTDKGFGLALGPAAPASVQAAFERLDYRVEAAASDWHLGPNERLLAAELIVGWADAACEVSPGMTAAIREWQGARAAACEEGRLVISVGHVDVAAWPRREV